MSLATLLTGLAGASALAWLYLLTLHGSFWRLREWLPSAAEDVCDGEGREEAWPAVVALVPARDEADTIGETVRSVLGQVYPGPLHLVVTDDQSSDGTAALAREVAAAVGAEKWLTVVPGETPPSGWTGKLWALEQARRAAQEIFDAPPGFLWLTDADIRHAPETLRRLVMKADSDDRDLVSLMVRLSAEGAWARLLIPPFILFFRMLYPFARANDPRRRLAAAAVGCVLLRRAAFERAGGFAAIAGRIIDDCALAARVKAEGREGPGRIWIGQGDASHSLRPYRDLREIWRMVARTAYAQLRYSPLLLLGTVLGLALVFLVPPVVALGWPLHGVAHAAWLGFAAWGAMTVAALPVFAHYEAGLWRAACLPVAAGAYTAMTLGSARAYRQGAGGLWKGRVQAGREAAADQTVAKADHRE